MNTPPSSVKPTSPSSVSIRSPRSDSRSASSSVPLPPTTSEMTSSSRSPISMSEPSSSTSREATSKRTSLLVHTATASDSITPRRSRASKTISVSWSPLLPPRSPRMSSRSRMLPPSSPSLCWACTVPAPSALWPVTPSRGPLPPLPSSDSSSPPRMPPMSRSSKMLPRPSPPLPPSPPSSSRSTPVMLMEERARAFTAGISMSSSSGPPNPSMPLPPPSPSSSSPPRSSSRLIPRRSPSSPSSPPPPVMSSMMLLPPSSPPSSPPPPVMSSRVLLPPSPPPSSSGTSIGERVESARVSACWMPTPWSASSSASMVTMSSSSDPPGGNTEVTSGSRSTSSDPSRSMLMPKALARALDTGAADALVTPNAVMARTHVPTRTFFMLELLKGSFVTSATFGSRLPVAGRPSRKARSDARRPCRPLSNGSQRLAPLPLHCPHPDHRHPEPAP